MSDSGESDDDVPQLSAEAMEALREFYTNQEIAGAMTATQTIVENWHLSQFWYDDKTALVLAKEALRAAGPNGRIACVASPTLYQKLLLLKPESCTTVLLEFDKRFEIFDDFVFYDYRKPLELSDLEQNSFDVVITDPPYLTDECLCRMAQTTKFLSKDKIILCTGTVMKDLAYDLLGVTICPFVPHHINNLANEFCCYTNYDAEYLINRENS